MTDAANAVSTDPVPDDLACPTTVLSNEEDPPPSERPSYLSFSHRALALRLKSAIATGQLGTSQPEPNPADFSFLILFFTTIPTTFLLVQLIWSSLIVLISNFLAPRGVTSLSLEFWHSRLALSSPVLNAVGWALFVLLSFLIREASNRYWQAQLALSHISGYLRYVMRDLRQGFPPGSWHPGDLQRVAAHLIAFPIALKMHLRGERERQPFEGILCEPDIDDILQAEHMHFHCTRIVRTYFSAAQGDATISFQSTAMDSCTIGGGTHHLLVYNVDAVDSHAGTLLTISSFSPSPGYLNHLRIFLYIWMLLLPLAVVGTSGWFTILWTVLITYCIAMLYSIAFALNDPFGYDLQDIKLNRFSAQTSLQLLNAFSLERLEYAAVIDPQHETPPWLEQPCPKTTKHTPRERKHSFMQSALSVVQSFRITRPVGRSLAALLAWTAFIVFLTWSISRNEDHTSCRWWCVYIPLGGSTDVYLSLGLFLLIGFWLNDAYKRYSRGIELWQTKLKPAIEEAAFRFAVTCDPGTWHQRDRERLYSFFVAIPYVAKQVLRGTRDMSELHAFLSESDAAACGRSENMFEHVMDVIYAYNNTLDSGNREFCQLSASPIRDTWKTVPHVLREIENAVQECMAMHEHPISPSLTLHLRAFSAFWLALLPLALVQFNGFLVFLYIVPMGFSIINLLKIGTDLSDPFGFDDHDIPLQAFCEEIKLSLHEMYENSKRGTVGFVRESSYGPESFQPLEVAMQVTSEGAGRDAGKQLSTWKCWNFFQARGAKTLSRAIPKILQKMPSIKGRDMVQVIVWNAIAVFVSYGFSFVWDDEKRTSCRGWCGPVDVDPRVMGNVGFALFLILTFRASEAIGRYEDGYKLLFDLRAKLRTFAIEICHNYQSGMFHHCDKERLVAHVLQIPFSLREHILGREGETTNHDDQILSESDKQKLQLNNDHLSYLLQTLEAYVILGDKEIRNGHPDMTAFRCQKTMVILMMSRILAIGELTQRVLAMKRFPFVTSYTKHQHLFTILWLMLLPLAMTPGSGFFTLLWAPIISYGVLGLESIAVKLTDPFGTDDIDIPVDDFLQETAFVILDAVQTANWDCTRYIQRSNLNFNDKLDVTKQDDNDASTTTVPHPESEYSSLFRNGTQSQLNFLDNPCKKYSLYSHIVRSVPWKQMIFLCGYTTVAVAVSYGTRHRASSAKWWLSRLSIDKLVATYVSFAAFMLMGFYLNAAFERYKDGGILWVDTLHSSCHSIAVHFLTLFQDGAIHEGDHERIFAHIAAIPLVLKAEVRNSRDITDVSGILSQQDLNHILCARDMSRHCVEVLKAYQITAASRPEYTKKRIVSGRRLIAMKRDMESLEMAVQRSAFLSSISISPGFLILLKALLVIWFSILPFALSEISGWFTILWVTLIGYGVLGMFTIAWEIQHPFGSDLNDFDIDGFARTIVKDVFFTWKKYRRGENGLIHTSDIHSFWTDPISKDKQPGPLGKEKTSVLENFKLAYNVFSPLLLVLVVVWTVISITVAWLVSKHFPFDKEFNESCDPWFCSRIAIDSAVAEYIGFALFLLLGFRIFDSHWRYTKAIQIWQKGIVSKLRVASNRFFQSYCNNVWHNQDVDRIAAHLAAFPPALMGRLRKTDEKDIFESILSEDDVQEMVCSPDRTTYCIDVVQNYLARGDLISAEGNGIYPAGRQEKEYIWKYLQQLKESAFECHHMVGVPAPYGYVQHLRIFLVIWLMLLPFALVESSGWLTILWVVLVAYGVIGIEKWATELSDPFGYDISDVPLDAFVKKAIMVIKSNRELYGNGVKDVLENHRSGLVVD